MAETLVEKKQRDNKMRRSLTSFEPLSKNKEKLTVFSNFCLGKPEQLLNFGNMMEVWGGWAD